MNNYEKMRRTNHQAREKLKDMGYSDVVTFGHSRFQKDVYGFDMVCKFKTLNSELFDIYWIQVKTGHIRKKERESIENFCMRSGEKALIIERIPYKEKYKKKKGSYTKHEIRVTEID